MLGAWITGRCYRCHETADHFIIECGVINIESFEHSSLMFARGSCERRAGCCRHALLRAYGQDARTPFRLTYVWLAGS